MCANYVVATQDCPGVLEAGFSCLEALEDVCDEAGACEEENVAFAECHAAYCDEHVDDPACEP